MTPEDDKPLLPAPGESVHGKAAEGAPSPAITPPASPGAPPTTGSSAAPPTARPFTTSNPPEPATSAPPPAAAPGKPRAPAAAPPAPREPLVTERKPARPAERSPRPAGRGLAALAVLLALLALAGAAWALWQQRSVDAAAVRSSTHQQQRLDAMQAKLQSFQNDRTAIEQRLREDRATSSGQQQALASQDARLRQLEGAVAKLSEQSLSGHDAMLLDQADSLLRMGAERYALFHDASGAAAAFGLADQALAGVRDQAFAGVRQAVQDERRALLQNGQGQQPSALDELSQLRAGVAQWPLKPQGSASTLAPGSSVWSRISHALGSVVRISRDNDASLATGDTRLVRELTALDLAQAQAALLAHDANGYRAALQRAHSSLEQQFDPAAESVRDARAVLDQLGRAAQPQAPVALGAALAELRNLRTVHALQPSPAAAPATGTSPAPAPTTPAATGSAGAPPVGANAGSASSGPVPAAAGSAGALP